MKHNLLNQGTILETQADADWALKWKHFLWQIVVFIKQR